MIYKEVKPREKYFYDVNKVLKFKFFCVTHCDAAVTVHALGSTTLQVEKWPVQSLKNKVSVQWTVMSLDIWLAGPLEGDVENGKDLSKEIILS